jgi:DNA gyrase subunit B
MDLEHIKDGTEYGASQIQVLEGLEAVRKRPGMYIGTTSVRGLHHLVYEIVDNAIDEALAGFCTEISVVIEEGDIICVTDNGRGIPVGIQEQTGKSALEVVFTVLHAGGKFGGGGYKVAGGLHGVGDTVVNALSEWLEATVSDGESVWQMKFARGIVTQGLTKIGQTDKTGSKIRFKPDAEIFEDTVFVFETLHTRLREQAFLNAGLKIILEDQRKGKEEREVLHYEGGIKSFVEEINKNKTALHEPVIYFSGEKDDSIAEIAFSTPTATMRLFYPLQQH